MTDELIVLKDVAGRLEKTHIQYMLTGSMALSFYATPRMTRDIDIIIQLCSDNIGQTLALFEDDFYIDPDCVAEAVRDNGMFNVIHNETVFKVDFIIRKNEPYRLEEFSRRRRIAFGDDEFSVVSPEDLILSKLIWGKMSDSELQFRDVRLLLASVKGLDELYLAKWAGILGVYQLLKKAAAHE